MKILGIDTSTPCGSVGLIDGDSIIAEGLLDIPVTHSERLLLSIDTVLKQGGCSVEDLDGWAVSLGPGSFTGLRIGVSAIKGLAFATQRPVAGVPTLDVLAANVAPTPYLICPILDARRGEVYSALFRHEEGNELKRVSAYEAVRPEDLVKRVGERTIFLGSGVRTYRDYLCNALPALATFARGPLNLPHGSVVARLGLERVRRSDILHLATFTPIYVRASEAEIKWKEKYSDGAPKKSDSKPSD